MAMKRKILLVGPEFHDLNESISRGFIDLGNEVRSISFRENELYSIGGIEQIPLKGPIVNRFLGKMRGGISKISGSKIGLEGKISPKNPKMRKFERKIKNEISDFQPDALFVIKGTFLESQALRRIKKDFPSTALIHWALDSVLRYPDVVEGLSWYDKIFTYEPSDIDGIKSLGFKAEYLPPGYDPTVYRLIDYAEKPKSKGWDIAFVGAGQNERFETIDRLIWNLAQRRKNIRIGIFGPHWSRFKFRQHPIISKFIKLEIHPNSIRPEEVNNVYNMSKICLNLHHRQSKMGVNPRTFEIPGSGSLELVDWKPVLNDFFLLNKEILSFHNEEEIPDLICDILSNDDKRKDIARNGFERVKRDHTFSKRMEQVMRSLQ